MRSVWWRPAIWPLAILAALAAPACGTGTAGRAAEGEPAARRQLTIEVENHNWADVVVYAVRGGMRTRLGMVTSMGSERFAVPAALLAGGTDLRLLADPLGGSAPYLFPPVMVQRGQRVAMRLENNLRLSSLSVW